MANQKLDMSYTIKNGGIFPYIELGDYVLHIMTNFDQPDSEMDFSITTGRICAYTQRDISQTDLAKLIRDGEIYSDLTNSDLTTLIEENENKILHFVEYHEDYMRGPPFPDYESIEG